MDALYFYTKLWLLYCFIWFNAHPSALFEPGDLHFEVERDPSMEPSIVETTEKAIRILQKNPRGFFLLVEGEDKSFNHLPHTPIYYSANQRLGNEIPW